MVDGGGVDSNDCRVTGVQRHWSVGTLDPVLPESRRKSGHPLLGFETVSVFCVSRRSVTGSPHPPSLEGHLTTPRLVPSVRPSVMTSRTRRASLSPLKVPTLCSPPCLLSVGHCPCPRRSRNCSGSRGARCPWVLTTL